MRLATWNVNSVIARLPRLVEWLEQESPDVLCLQETKIANDAFPAEPMEALGYEVVAHGDGRWNGVALLSRIGVEAVQRGFVGQPGYATVTAADEGLFEAPVEPVVEARAVAATCGRLRVWSVYVPNGRAVGDPHYDYKLAWLAAFRVAVAEEVKNTSGFVVCGDFNIAPTDADVWDPAAFATDTHVTPPERAAYSELLGVGLTDVMPRAMKGPHPFTYWDYRAGCFHKNMGMRIDLVLGDQRFAGAVTDAFVDREARKGKGPSDHAPVVVDLDL